LIKRTLEISREPAHLALRLDQIVLERDDQVAGSIPCEDLAVVVVDHPRTTYTHGALARLMEAGAVVVICGRNHLPSGFLVPVPCHSEVVWRVQDQIAAPRPLRKRLWQQIVRAKIRAQALNLRPGCPAQRKLLLLARDVLSGDAGAHESQAARLYWASWLDYASSDRARADPTSAGAEPPADPRAKRFHRDHEGDGLNAFLNYGYAILRAAVARAIVAAGLHPALGLQHSNRSNAFCLADDLIEPLRPLVDRRARALYEDGRLELDQSTKAALLEVLAEEVVCGDATGPLMVALHRYVASLVRCLRHESKGLLFPQIHPRRGDSSRP
jgi:CRISPR-associated protein Cas1